MPKRCWGIVIATGIAFVSLGQAQEQAQSPQQNTPAEQQPAQTLPIPIPVEIVSDEATTEASERSEDEARQREIDDLIAQQGMNEATRAMNDATQDMRDYAYVQTALIGVGTVLLFITLWLTWQANRAAVKSVEITERAYRVDQRPWVAFQSRLRPS